MPEPTSLVVEAMRGFKRALLDREAVAVQEMIARWSQLEKALVGSIDALSIEASQLAATGEALSPGKVYQMDRYKRLLVQAQDEFEQYAAWADGHLVRLQSEMARLGLEHSAQAI